MTSNKRRSNHKSDTSNMDRLVIPKVNKKPKPRSEQLLPSQKAITGYWQALKDGAKEGDMFCTAALIILTREQQLAWKDISDMAILYRLFREESDKFGEDEDEGEDADDD